MAKKKPEDVFTPRTIPTRAMFETRNLTQPDGGPGVQDLLQDALSERGGQVLVYGDTGVGKSSLVTYAAEDEKLGYIVVECDVTMNYDSILDFAIHELVDVREIERSTHRSVSAEAGVSSDVVPWFTKITGKLKGSFENERTFEVTEQSALSVLTKAMEASGKTLIVLDNFQNIPITARKRVSQGLETLSDRAGRDHNSPDFKFIVIGIATDAASLLGSSVSYGRRTTEIEVPRMSDEEIKEILRTGFNLLDLTLGNQDLNRMAFFSDGFPYFAHLLGLNASRTAVRQGSRIIDPTTIEVALTRAARAVEASYSSRVQRASEVGGNVQPRRTILRLLAKSAQRAWLGTEIVELWEKDAGGPIGNNAFIHTAATQLTKEEYGSILIRTGDRRRYSYAFADPHMRPFLRIKGLA